MRSKIILVVLLLSFCLSLHAQKINVVPYPRSFKEKAGEFFVLRNGFTVKAAEGFSAASSLFIEDVSLLYSLNGKTTSRKADIQLLKDKSLAEEAYKLEVSNSGVIISAANYNSIVMGVTTLMQLIESNTGRISACVIEDEPVHAYRSYMLDVARQWVEMPTVKQIVDLCRWYKVRYMQIHLTDDQIFTFESKKYPKLATPGKHYTQKELKALVAYAAKRGVILIPEFDLPGHSGTMRRHMPELFGQSAWGVIDMVNPKTMAAIKEIIKEIVNVFYTSPFFHIGADEAWFEEYSKLPHVKEYIKSKGLDNSYDIYMQCIVEMHEFVKSCGKKTLVWESFHDKGSRKVQIPNDLTVIAWETMYQTPQSLIANGYEIINASWKPMYTTPGRRWSPQYIYEWNLRKWENHWNLTPSYQKPIQLSDNTMLHGAQMCAWEMIDYEQLLTAHKRIAAFSENVWNDTDKRPYADFNIRLCGTDHKVMTMLFPAREERSGFLEDCIYGLNDNQINYFGAKGSVWFEPIHRGDYITYTTDGSFPATKSPQLEKPLELATNTVVKYAMFNAKNKLRGYKSIQYRHEPISVVHIGQVRPILNRDIHRDQENFVDMLSIALRNINTAGSIHYTLNGSDPTKDSPKYSDPIKINTNTTLRVACIVDGKPVGEEYRCDYIKANIENNITTGKPILLGKEISGSAIANSTAVDGIVDIDRYWEHEGAASLVLDIQKVITLQANCLYTYWDNNRYYQYTIDISIDGKNWKQVVDRSKNTEKATADGYTDLLANKVEARYVRVNMLRNSVNPAVHIVEWRLY